MLINEKMIISASRLCRWNGYTHRHYSVLEHTIIGTKLLDDEDAKRHFMLHDFHETIIVGDVPTPDREKYMNDYYHTRINEIDRQIYKAYGMLNGLTRAGCLAGIMDEALARVEHDVICSMTHENMGRPDYKLRSHDSIRSMIFSAQYQGDNAIHEFHELYEELFNL